MSLIVNYSDGTQEVFDVDYESVEEGLTDLRRKGFAISLDVSRVPENLRNDPRLAEYELIISLRLTDRQFRAALALHEAAHAEYMERAGVDYMEIVLPYAWVNRHGELVHSNTAVCSKDKESRQFEDLDYVKTVICAGIAEEVMVGRPTNGNGHDEDQLRDVFERHAISEEEQARLLKQARADILKDLRSPSFRGRLWQRATFFQRALEQALYGRIL